MDYSGTTPFGIRKLVDRYTKFVELDRDYVEKIIEL